ncbi:MAG: SIMPL domain-containing protein [Caldilineaceae bacterium]|nr:SIMPL domain-containing protein [Caldilineaceae bacterium]
MKPIYLCLAFMLLLAGCATVEAPTIQPEIPNSAMTTTPARTIVVVGNGNTRVKANQVRVNLGVEVVDETVVEANRTASAIMQQVLDALARQQIADADIQPYAYNVQAERYYADYARDDPGTVPLFPAPGEEIRYRVLHQIHVLVRDLDRVDTVVDAVIEAGGNNVYIYGTDFLYDDPESLEPEARAQALKDAEEKAGEIAQLIGVEVGPVQQISEIVGHSGVYWDSDIAPLWPGQLQFYMSLQVTYGVSSTTPLTATSSLTETPAATTTGAISGANSSELDTVTIHGGNEETLREFLRQYLIAPFGFNDETATTVTVGTLPPDLPLNLEIPAGVTTAGAIVTTGEYSNTQLLFSLEGEVADSLAALRQQLQNQGYFQPAPPSGEVFQTQPDDFVSWCNPEGTLAVVVTGRNLADRTGIIRLFITHVLPANGPCASAPAGASGSSGDLENALPTLAAPPNVAAFQSGMSSGGDSVEATVGFSGDTTIAALAEHYNSQLEDADWQRLGASQTEDMAWSGWSLTKDDRFYSATFYIVRDAGSSDHFRATLRIEQAR